MLVCVQCVLRVCTELSLHLLLLSLASSTHAPQSPVLYHRNVQTRPEKTTTTCGFKTQNKLGGKNKEMNTREEDLQQKKKHGTTHFPNLFLVSGDVRVYNLLSGYDFLPKLSHENKL